jgi:hypothetical protein
MRTLKLSALVAAVLFLVASQACKKNDKTCELATMTVSDGISTVRPYKYFYDESGEIRKIIYPNDTYDSIARNADTLRVWTRNFLDTLVGYTEGLTNAQGYITSGFHNGYDNLGQPLGNNTFLYEYNADGTLMRITANDVLGTRILYFTYAGGNKTEGILYENGTITERYAFEYTADENKSQLDDLMFLNNDYFQFDGKASTNTLKTIFTYLGNDTIKTLFINEFNEYGYTTKVSKTDSNAVGFDRTFYSLGYNCTEN